MRGSPADGLFRPPTKDLTGVCCAIGTFFSSTGTNFTYDAALSLGVNEPSKLP